MYRPHLYNYTQRWHLYLYKLGCIIIVPNYFDVEANIV